MAKSIMCPGKNYLLVKVKEGREYKSLVLVCLLGTKGSLNDLNYIRFENLFGKVFDLPTCSFLFSSMSTVSFYSHKLNSHIIGHD
jgi:hypothetical protein